MSNAPSPPVSSASPPPVNYMREVRFAVVMYGGVSLAIYINGIAQEMLRWARSTARHSTLDVALIPSNPTTNATSNNAPTLTGTERVYRKLSYILSETGSQRSNDPKETLKRAEQQLANNEPLRTRFIVDILSGTSAGGINGIFLAKALANGEDISGLENLWIKEGDMRTLINDKKSVEGPLKLQDPPASLLNSQRMYFELLKAFDSMEKTGAGSAPFVDELDLFVTTTDLSGVTLPIRLSDGVVYERRHRNVLRFVYSNKDASAEAKDRNDFEAKFNPFLAYAARCTSAFPAAFEPMCLCDTDAILKGYAPYANKENCRSDSSDWQRFYKDYLNPAGVDTVRFPKRAFADGGYLDNKPFTYATETVAHRQADLLITRKLIYIEPSPEHPEEQPDAEGKPDAIENVGAALLSLPRYETIREDLQRLREHNRLVERVNSILKLVEVDKKLGKPAEKGRFNDEQWGKMDLGDVVREKGVGYVAYHRLDVSAVSDDLAKLVTRVAGFDEESDNFMIIRSLVGAWRANTYVEHREEDNEKPTLNQFLFEFNLSYPMRRINFLRTKISDLGTAKEYQDNLEAQAELVEIKKKLNHEYKNLRRAARRLRSRQVPTKMDAATGGSVPSPAYEAIQKLKEALAAESFKRLPEEVRNKIDPSEAVVEYFLGVRSNGGTSTRSTNVKDESDARARALLENLEFAALFVPIAEALKAEIGPAKKQADENCRAALGLKNEDPGSESALPNPNTDSREYLAYYYQNYDEYDRIVFPIIYGTEIGEAAKVDIIRISPEDATALINERETGCYKLAGSSLGHFGAFLDPLWRRNDILWGRLDGAERIITALLPNDPTLARLLVGQAHAAIVREALIPEGRSLGETEAKNLLCESAMRTRSGTAECEILTQFIGNLKAYDSTGQLETLIDDKALRQHYLDTFAVKSRLEPESTMKLAARATTVLGNMLSDLSDRRNVKSSSVAWIARFGQIFTSLVEVSVPRSIPNLLLRHWLKLLYLFEVFLIVGATVLSKPGAAQLGWTLLGITVAVNVITWWLNDFMQRRRVIMRFVILLLAMIFALLAIVGGLKLAGVLFGVTINEVHPLTWISQNLKQLSHWFEDTLGKAIWGFVLRFLPLITALLGILVLWKLGKPQKKGLAINEPN